MKIFSELEHSPEKLYTPIPFRLDFIKHHLSKHDQSPSLEPHPPSCWKNVGEGEGIEANRSDLFIQKPKRCRKAIRETDFIYLSRANVKDDGAVCNNTKSAGLQVAERAPAKG